MSAEDLEDDSEQRAQATRAEQLLEELNRDGELAQLKQLLQIEAMRDFVWRVLKRCHVYASLYSRNFGDMALAEGSRQIGLWLLTEVLQADPEAEIAMKRKANALESQRAATQRARRTARAPRS